MKRFLVAALSFMVLEAGAQQKMTREQYIQKYKYIVLEQMDIYGIPASIKMAQALFESDNGNSRLAVEANNHFGIKCKSTWMGATIRHTDDHPDECFRKYNSAEESFKDHSEFLDKSPRYQDLFKLDPLDYKGWANGLSKAGYATSPTYAAALIKIIEDNELYLLDQGGNLPSDIAVETKPVHTETVAEVEHLKVKQDNGKVDVDNYSVSVNGGTTVGGKHVIYQNNGSQFILAEENDTFESVAREFGTTPKKLRKYNDVDADAVMKTGDMVYTRIKSTRSRNAKLIHIVKEGETMYDISQIYGIRLKNLLNINRKGKDTQIKAGQQIRLM